MSELILLDSCDRLEKKKKIYINITDHINKEEFPVFKAKKQRNKERKKSHAFQ